MLCVLILVVEEQCRWRRGGDIFKHTGAHLVELLCPKQALGVNLSPSRIINRIVLMLTGDRENENEIEMAVLMFMSTVGSKPIHAIQAHYKGKI